ncbi:acyl-CoA dehydrogenase family protein [Kurthia sibirica]|uniref:Acyl-CoA dehydrogenase n=1 Tax=Kurthia sibirica TaxID=202750 RepID=A0A2U3ALQ1_9BACL|nr:acyl-CoA dehydrogenase family protein [Kurthia sibirica]PWI25461.1 acyl-CoA dehydrogenase [Kurthia sibirica]GEK34958.1 hypothetical protein KSI01_24910 [Kurthia sibirica]
MTIDKNALQQLLVNELVPYVKNVDEEAYYAKEYLVQLGKRGFLKSTHKTPEEIVEDGCTLVYETSKICMTTAFCLWCHLAALTYIRHTANHKLQAKLLEPLETGLAMGATGLSNPMKFYADLEKLYLTAERTETGYVINGILPSVSNLGHDHWFGALAQVDDGTEVMFIINTTDPRIVLKEKAHFIGLNGSATYACKFTNVIVSNDDILAHDARHFCTIIRPYFIAYQIPLGLGVMNATVQCIEKVKGKQNGSNQYLPLQASDILEKERLFQQRLQHIINKPVLADIIDLRLESAYATLEATQASMLHNGSAGYIAGSVSSRKLREGYFYVNLTPTIRQLEKMTALRLQTS